VAGVSLELRTGEAIGIIGPNGAGKSTLFNLISGSLTADEGAIRLDGRDVTTTPPHRRCRQGIGRSFQIPHPFENLTVFENLLVGSAHGRGLKERAVVSACGTILEQTGLLPLANRLGRDLTLLQRKRLELARGLASGPRILLLDEIAGGLTEAECRMLIETIREVRSMNVAIIWIEHVVHALLAVIDRLIVLDRGRKIAEGEPRTVMNSAAVRESYLGLVA
jgi:branched-chain amino acid transport system ATP-binding protein